MHYFLLDKIKKLTIFITFFEMQLFMRSIKGRSLIFNVSDDETVESFKLKICEKDGIKPEQIRLIFGGRQLEDGNLLSDYGLQENSTVVLVLKLPGGD